MRRLTPMLLLVAWGLLTGCDDAAARAPGGNVQPQVQMALAASTAHVIEPLAERYRRQHGVDVHCNAAASSTLAHQIEQGAPVDVYLSANQRWMDHLAGNGRIQPGTRLDLLANRLVLIRPRDDNSTRAPADRNAADTLRGFTGRLAMGDPDHVPAGLYGKAALATAGLWETLQPQVVPTKDVRSALLLVERGEVDLGIVYATDAIDNDHVAVVAVFDARSHPPIHYPIALIRDAKPEARLWLAYLQSPEARAAFEAAGFTVLAGARP